jgi:uncharacterized membrane protein YkoI
MKKINQFTAFIAAGMLALTMGLTACGSNQPQSTQAPAAEAATEAQPVATTEAQPEAQPEAAAPAQVESQKSTPPAQAPAAPDQYIGYDEAKRIALADAGLTEADCHKLEVELDTDDYQIHYDVDFESGMYEYDYDIDAVTGEILFSRSEYDD